MVDYDPQLLLEHKPEDKNVSEVHFIEVPCGSLVANRPVNGRRDGQSFKMYWKSRRNANKALKKRLREGPNSTMTLEIKTMDVVSEREKYMRENDGRLPQVEAKRQGKPYVKRDKKSKGLKLAGGR